MWEWVKKSEQTGLKLEGPRQGGEPGALSARFSSVWHCGVSVPSEITTSLFTAIGQVWLFLWTGSISSSHTYHLNLDAQGGRELA